MKKNNLTLAEQLLKEWCEIPGGSPDGRDPEFDRGCQRRTDDVRRRLLAFDSYDLSQEADRLIHAYARTLLESGGTSAVLTRHREWYRRRFGRAKGEGEEG